MTARRQDRSTLPGPPRTGRRSLTEPVPADEDEAVDVVEGGEAVGIPSVGGILKGIASALAQPGPVTRGAGRLVRGLGVDRPRDRRAPALPKDKRFADPAWSMNPVFRRLGQGYLALGAQLDRWSTSTRRPPRTGTTSNGPGSRWAR